MSGHIISGLCFALPNMTVSQYHGIELGSEGKVDEVWLHDALRYLIAVSVWTIIIELWMKAIIHYTGGQL